MYAIVEIYSKQYKAIPGETITLDNFPLRKKKEVEFKNVLLIAEKRDMSIGTPLVKGAKVLGEIIKQGKGRKIKVFRYIKRESYHRMIGHRQLTTQIKIKEIKAGD